jgi:hypothetical protein
VFGFQDEYDPSNWTFTTSSDGSVDTTSAPTSITLTGGGDGSGNSGFTDYTIAAAADGTVMFDWDYFSSDEPGFDSFGTLLNGAFTFLTDSDGDNGTFMFDVLAGDTFGFRVATFDNFAGPGNATISNFEAPAPMAATPEPTSILSLLALGTLGAGIKRLKEKS